MDELESCIWVIGRTDEYSCQAVHIAIFPDGDVSTVHDPDKDFHERDVVSQGMLIVQQGQRSIC
jgi:hypothetical protein